MTTNITYNIRIDKQIRKQADALFRSMGMSLSTAVNLFLTQAVVQGKLPLTEVIAEPVYAEALLRDVVETDEALKNGTATIYQTPDELFAVWAKEDQEDE
jgi:DNA-damage-inducible protein J